jgi:hypothetical protein
MKLNRALATFALLASFTAAAPAFAAATTAPSVAHTRQASIPFVNHGGIRDWRPDGRDAILIQASNRHWYRATFFGPCQNLNFSLRVGFLGGPTDTLDRFSSILVDHQKCDFRTFDEVPAPAPHADHR